VVAILAWVAATTEAMDLVLDVEPQQPPRIAVVREGASYRKNPKNGGLGLVERGRRLVGFCRLV
jgi:hypothetical protein